MTPKTCSQEAMSRKIFRSSTKFLSWGAEFQPAWTSWLASLRPYINSATQLKGWDYGRGQSAGKNRNMQENYSDGKTFCWTNEFHISAECKKRPDSESYGSSAQILDVCEVEQGHTSHAAMTAVHLRLEQVYMKDLKNDLHMGRRSFAKRIPAI